MEFTPGQFPNPDLPPPFLRGIFAPSRLPKALSPTVRSGELGGFKRQTDTSDGWADRAEQADEADGVGSIGLIGPMKSPNPPYAISPVSPIRPISPNPTSEARSSANQEPRTSSRLTPPCGWFLPFLGAHRSPVRKRKPRTSQRVTPHSALHAGSPAFGERRETEHAQRRRDVRAAHVQDIQPTTTCAQSSRCLCVNSDTLRLPKASPSASW